MELVIEYNIFPESHMMTTLRDVYLVVKGRRARSFDLSKNKVLYKTFKLKYLVKSYSEASYTVNSKDLLRLKVEEKGKLVGGSLSLVIEQIIDIICAREETFRLPRQLQIDVSSLTQMIQMDTGSTFWRPNGHCIFQNLISCSKMYSALFTLT